MQLSTLSLGVSTPKLPQASSIVNTTLFQVISTLGLTTGLKLCLDAGDVSSYNTAVQTDKWLDVSGGGYDFFLGAGTGASATDPTFNGTSGGLSVNEFFSFDGGDFLTYDTANEVWLNNLHKAGANYTIFIMTSTGSLGTDSALFGNNANATTNIGIGFRKNTTNQLRLTVSKTGASLALGVNSTVTMSANTWQGIGVSVNEASATGTFFVSGTSESFTSTYATPSTGDASFTTQIGATGNAATPIAAGSKIACIAVWEGTSLSDVQLNSVYANIKTRFGL